MRLSPTLSKLAPYTIIEDDIDFWYDSINDCYSNGMMIDMICSYIEAINDEDTE